jgi:hypothetical protein
MRVLLTLSTYHDPKGDCLLLRQPNVARAAESRHSTPKELQESEYERCETCFPEPLT